MKQFEALKIIGQSESFARQLAQIETDVLTWADNKQKLYKMFAKQASRYKEVIKAFPGEWLRASSNQFVAGYVFGNPGRLHKYLHNNRDFIDKESKNLLHHFMDSPWFYSLFQITESYPDNILKARDCSSGDEFLLYSENTANLFKQGKSLFMALLFDNGKCCQTYSIIHYYQGYSVEDFISFAYLVSYHYKNSHNLSESIKNKPIEYMLLDRFAEIPVTMHNGEPVVFCSHSLKAESFDPEEYAEQFFKEEKNDIVKCSLKKYQGTMFFTCLYFDKMKNNLLLHAIGLSRYRELVDLLKNKYDFPQQPSWYFSTQMTAVVDAVLGIKNPSLAYDKYFDNEPDIRGENSPDLKPINDLMRELTDHTNTGKKYSIQELAAKHDVPVETALQLEGMLKEMDKKFSIDLDGGFDDITPPPPAERLKFKEPLNRNPIFSIETIAEDVIQSLGLGLETQNDYIRLIDDLYNKVWGKRDYTILMYTLYLIHLKGDRYERADDYACECLKLFWQVLIPSKSKKEISRFLEKYNAFCVRVLLKTGLIVTNESPHLKIKASDLFYKVFCFKK